MNDHRTWARRLLTSTSLGVVIAFLPPPVRALTDEEVFRDFRFNFINPGGRSLGMGGAFISIADDATAARANPAGLTNMLSPQLFFEIRYSDADPTTVERGFSNPPFDAYAIAVETRPDNQTIPSFLSYVGTPSSVPSICYGFSRQEVLGTHNVTASTFDFTLPPPQNTQSTAGNIDVQIVTWNASIGWLVHDRFRIGGTVSYAQLDLQSEVINSFTDPSGQIFQDPSLIGVPVEMYRSNVNAKDAGFSWAAGFIWNPASDISVGGVYRKGAQFTVPESIRASFFDTNLLPGQIVANVFLNENDTLPTPDASSFTIENQLHVPDQFGLGISGRVFDALTLSLDAVRTNYSQLLDGFNARLNLLTSGFASEEDARFIVDDQTNLHFGLEYGLPASPNGNQIRLRAGWHQDRDNRIRADFPSQTPGLGENANFPAGPDLDHYSIGVGGVFKSRFQFDAAADASEQTIEGVISFIVRF